jgi:hypothetical protein
MRSTDGPLEAAMIRCPAGHWFTGAIGSLTWNSEHKHDPCTSAVPSTARHGSLPWTHDVRDSTGGVTRHELPAGQGQAVRRPNCTPAYYQGRPAHRWITAMRHSRTAGSRPMQAITGGGEGTPPLGGGLTSAQVETIRATPAPTSWPRGTVSA